MDVVKLKELAQKQENEIRELSGDGIYDERTIQSNAVIADKMRKTLNEQMQHLGHLGIVLARIPVKRVPLYVPWRNKGVRAGMARIPVKHHVPLTLQTNFEKMIELAQKQEKEIRELSGRKFYDRTIKSNGAIAVKMRKTLNEQMQHLGHFEIVLAKIPVKRVPRRRKVVTTGMNRIKPVAHVPLPRRTNDKESQRKVAFLEQAKLNALTSLMNKVFLGGSTQNKGRK